MCRKNYTYKLTLHINMIYVLVHISCKMMVNLFNISLLASIIDLLSSIFQTKTETKWPQFLQLLVRAMIDHRRSRTQTPKLSEMDRLVSSIKPSWSSQANWWLSRKYCRTRDLKYAFDFHTSGDCFRVI